MSFADARVAYDRAIEEVLDDAECRRVASLFERVSDDESLERQALYNAGLLWRLCGDPDRGRSLFERVVSLEEAGEPSKRTPAYVAALIHLSTYESRAGRTEEARALLNKALEADDRSTEAASQMALLSLDTDDLSKSLVEIRDAVGANATNLKADVLMARLYLKLAEEIDGQQGQGTMLGAVELVCQKAIERAGRSDEDQRDLASIHTIRGVVLMRKGEAARAAAAFESATKLAPGLFEAHINLGRVSLSFRDFHTAERAFHKALRLQPRSYPAHLGLGTALRGLERYEESKALYVKARELAPDRPEASYNLGVLVQDYLTAREEELDSQISHLREAKQHYREFLARCAQHESACRRARPEGSEPEDLRKTARRRITSCDDTIAGLEEAKRLAAEVERLQRQP